MGTIKFSAYPDGNTDKGTCTFSEISTTDRTNIPRENSRKGVYIGSTKARAVFKGNVQIWPEIKTLIFKNPTVGLPTVSLASNFKLLDVDMIFPEWNLYSNLTGSDILTSGINKYIKKGNYTQPVYKFDVYLSNGTTRLPLAKNSIINLKGNDIIAEWFDYDGAHILASAAVTLAFQNMQSDFPIKGFAYLKGNNSNKAELFLASGPATNAYYNYSDGHKMFMTPRLPLELPKNVTIARNKPTVSFSVASGNSNAVVTNSPILISPPSPNYGTVLKNYPLSFGFMDKPANSGSSTPHTSYVLHDIANTAYTSFRYIFQGCSWDPSCVSYSLTYGGWFNNGNDLTISSIGDVRESGKYAYQAYISLADDNWQNFQTYRLTKGWITNIGFYEGSAPTSYAYYSDNLYVKMSDFSITLNNNRYSYLNQNNFSQSAGGIMHRKDIPNPYVTNYTRDHSVYGQNKVTYYSEYATLNGNISDLHNVYETINSITYNTTQKTHTSEGWIDILDDNLLLISDRYYPWNGNEYWDIDCGFTVKIESNGETDTNWNEIILLGAFNVFFEIYDSSTGEILYRRGDVLWAGTSSHGGYDTLPNHGTDYLTYLSIGNSFARTITHCYDENVYRYSRQWQFGVSNVVLYFKRGVQSNNIRYRVKVFQHNGTCQGANTTFRCNELLYGRTTSASRITVSNLTINRKIGNQTTLKLNFSTYWKDSLPLFDANNFKKCISNNNLVYTKTETVGRLKFKTNYLHSIILQGNSTPDYPTLTDNNYTSPAFSYYGFTSINNMYVAYSYANLSTNGKKEIQSATEPSYCYYAYNILARYNGGNTYFSHKLTVAYMFYKLPHYHRFVTSVTRNYTFK